MSNDGLVDVPAAKLEVAVARVLPHTNPLAAEAGLVADEVRRLRDAGHLSETLAGDLSMLIYQRHMHSMHTGDFQLTEPIRMLWQEIDRASRGDLPEDQVDPVRVHPRVRKIIAS